MDYSLGLFEYIYIALTIIFAIDIFVRVTADNGAGYYAKRPKLRSLPDRLRLAVVLHYFHDMDVALTARALGVPQGTVKSRLSRARKQLKEVLGHDRSL